MSGNQLAVQEAVSRIYEAIICKTSGYCTRDYRACIDIRIK